MLKDRNDPVTIVSQGIAIERGHYRHCNAGHNYPINRPLGAN
jgi:hypothetical protein